MIPGFGRHELEAAGRDIWSVDQKDTDPAAELGGFFARYYAAMNLVSLVVQFLIAGRVVRHLGVAGATAVMPGLLLGGGVASLLAAGIRWSERLLNESVQPIKVDIRQKRTHDAALRGSAERRVEPPVFEIS